MKNTTKKILSMLLAVIMLLSVMPVAYAVEDAVVSAYLDEVVKVYTYQYNSYEPSNFNNEIKDIILEINIPFIEKTGIFLDVTDEDIYAKKWIESHKTDLPAVTEMLKEVNAAIEERIASAEIEVVISTYEFWTLNIGMVAYYDNTAIEEMFGEVINTNSELYQKYEVGMEEKNSLAPPVNFADQAEYDSFIDNLWAPMCVMLINCLDGNHPYGEYIPNNDATEEADGTKTATCEFCGATDTVVDEGSKLNNNDNSKCSCNCHKSGIMGLIWKIIKFFYKIFGMNKTCVCGVGHY